MGIDYQARKAAILASSSIEELKRTQNMPPVPACKDEENFVFISYSHMDYKSVYCDLLEFHKNGLRYWYDEGLPAGENWDKVVESQIKHPCCAGVIFYMSENLFLSKSVNKEVEFTVRGGEDGGEGKNYFCINLSQIPPMKIIFNIQRTREYDELERSGFIDCLSCLTAAFSNKSTYIPKSGDADEGHIVQTLKQIRERFGVFIDGAPIENNEEVQKLAKELELAKSFAIKDGVLLHYLGEGGDVIIPKGVIIISNQAFYDCKSITSVTIPDSVTRIDSEAFWGCTGLTSITIPNSITSIGNVAFGACFNLVKERNGICYVGDWIVKCAKNISVAVLCNNTRGIAGGAFMGRTALTNITIPDSVTSIGDHAFSGCTGLTSITIPDSVTSIGDSAFWDCTALTDITMPDSVTSIGDCAFWRCTALTDITIPDSVTSIGDQAFSGCTGLTSITIPDSVTSIGDFVFDACKSLTSIAYDGTMAQWSAIQKGLFWDDESGDYVVHCTDGDIPKSEM